MLQATHLEKKYDELAVVKGVSLSVKKGEIVSVTGASGAGKSTLLHMISGLDKPDRGKVQINGTDIFAMQPKALARFRNKHLGFVFQFHHLLPEFTAIENVAVPLWINGTDKATATKQAVAMLEKLGLKDRLQNKPAEMSGGEQQRVAIARALINNPSVVMADEPTGNLDSNNARAIHELFLDLRKNTGQTFVIVTHNEELAALTDRTLVMKDGLIKEEIINTRQPA